MNLKSLGNCTCGYLQNDEEIVSYYSYSYHIGN